MFDNEYHELALKLDELIRFRAHTSPEARLYLARELSSLGGRIEHYRAKLSSGAQEDAPDRDIDIELLDVEMEEPPMKEITS